MFFNLKLIERYFLLDIVLNWHLKNFNFKYMVELNV